jgi:hypothetical protein
LLLTGSTEQTANVQKAVPVPSPKISPAGKGFYRIRPLSHDSRCFSGFVSRPAAWGEVRNQKKTHASRNETLLRTAVIAYWFINDVQKFFNSHFRMFGGSMAAHESFGR